MEKPCWAEEASGDLHTDLQKMQRWFYHGSWSGLSCSLGYICPFQERHVRDPEMQGWWLKPPPAKGEGEPIFLGRSPKGHQVSCRL